MYKARVHPAPEAMPPERSKWWSLALRLASTREGLHQYLRFLTVGVGNAAVDLGALNILLILGPTHSQLMLLVYNSIAVALAIANSYYWNIRWTFSSVATGSQRERVLFITQAFVNILINNVALLVMTALLPVSTNLNYVIENNLAKLVAMALASTTSFVILRAMVFAGQRPS